MVQSALQGLSLTHAINGDAEWLGDTDKKKWGKARQKTSLQTAVGRFCSVQLDWHNFPNNIQ